jgi:hypothetical protein
MGHYNILCTSSSVIGDDQCACLRMYMEIIGDGFQQDDFERNDACLVERRHDVVCLPHLVGFHTKHPECLPRFGDKSTKTNNSHIV